MAVEVGLQARLARQKLKTNLALLNNASILTAEKVREQQLRKETYVETHTSVYDPVNWMSTYVLAATLIVFLLVFIFYKYGFISQLLFLVQPI